MNSDRIFYISTFSFFFSVFLNSFFNFGFTFGLLLVLLSFVIFFFYLFYLKGYKEGVRVVLLSIAIFSFAIGIIRYEFSDIKKNNAVLDNNIGEKVYIEGIVSEEPEKEDSFVKIIVSSEKILIEDNTSKKISGKILVKTNFYPEIFYGDRVKVSGKLSQPENFVSEGSPVFDYVSYLKKDNIYYQMSFAQTERISPNNANLLKGYLFRIKNNFLDNIKNQISEPESSLLGGLLLGVKDTLGKDWEEKFRNTGVAHIVVLSGYNITIVAESVMKVFSFLPRTFSFLFGLLSIVSFSIMTGGSSTVVRASLMATVLLLARFVRRDYKIKRVLIIAGVIMLLFNPKILVFDTSFQLSFLATLALVFVSPVFLNRLSMITERFGLREIVASTLATQFVVLPLILYKMGVFSLVFLPVNILILPFIPITMFFGFFSGLIGFMSSILTWPFSVISKIFLAYELKVVDLFSKIPFSSVQFKGWGVLLVVVFYMGIIYWLWIKKKESKLA